MDSLGFGLRFWFQDNATAGMKAASAQMDAMRQHAQGLQSGLASDVSRIGRTFNMLKVAATAAATGWVGQKIWGAAIGGASQFEQLRVSFDTMLGSAKLAREALAGISKFAAQTPFELPEVVNAGKMLLSYGVSADQLQGKLRLLGDAAAGMGVPLEQAVGVWAKAKAGLFETEQFASLGVTREALQQFGIQFTKTGEIVNRAQLMPAMERLLQSRFGGLMAKQAKTFSGILSNLADTTGRFWRVFAGMEDTGEVRKGSLFDAVRQQVGNLYDYLDKHWNDISDMTVRLGQAVSGGLQWLIRAGQGVLQFLQQMWGAFRETGAIDAVADALRNLGGVFAGVGGSGGDLARNVGQLLGIAFKAAAGAVNVLAGALRILRPILPEITAGFLAFRAVQTVRAGIDSFRNGVVGVILAYQRLKDVGETVYIRLLYLQDSLRAGFQAMGSFVRSAFTAMAGGVRAFTSFMVANPVIAVLTGIIAVGTVLYLAWRNNWLGIRDVTASFVKWFQGAWSGVTEWFSGAWKGVTGTVSGAMEFIGGLFQKSIATWKFLFFSFVAFVMQIADPVMRLIPGEIGKGWAKARESVQASLTGAKAELAAAFKPQTPAELVATVTSKPDITPRVTNTKHTAMQTNIQNLHINLPGIQNADDRGARQIALALNRQLQVAHERGY